MSARKFIVMLVLLALMSAFTAATGTDVFEVGLEPVSATDDNQAVKEELQPILRAMLGGMLDEQIAVIQYTGIASATVEELGGPPPCPEGVTEGTEIEVFPTLGSEGSYVAPENMQAFLNNAIVKSLYAVYRVTPNPNLEPYFPEGEYAMLFERNMNDILLPVDFTGAGWQGCPHGLPHRHLSRRPAQGDFRGEYVGDTTRSTGMDGVYSVENITKPYRNRRT